MCRRVRQRVAYMRMSWRSRWRSTEAFASSASVRGRGQARDLRAAPADLRGAARPSAGERRGVATRVRVACARRDAPKSEKNPREIPRALERDRETRAWEGGEKEPRASSAKAKRRRATPRATQIGSTFFARAQAFATGAPGAPPIRRRKGSTATATRFFPGALAGPGDVDDLYALPLESADRDPYEEVTTEVIVGGSLSTLGLFFLSGLAGLRRRFG